MSQRNFPVMRRILTGGLLGWAALGAALLPNAARAAGAVERIAGGIIVTPRSGAARRVRLEALAPQIIRVTEFPGSNLTLPKNLMAVRSGRAGVPFTVRQSGTTVALSTADLTAQVHLGDGQVVFRNAHGQVLSRELPGGSSFKSVTIDGDPYFAIRQQFESTPGEAFYGLGQHQTGRIDYKGRSLTLAQHNMNVVVPFVVSSRDYGILWDNTSITRFGNPRPWQQLSKSLILYNAQNQRGGLTARYYVHGKLVLERTERNIDYQYLTWHGHYPRSFPKALVKRSHVKVIWTGQIEARTSGLHTFSLYGSDYQQLWIGGRKIIDAWRQNWNPWYRNFRVRLQAGQRVPIRLVWNRDGGYIALLHRPPRPAAVRRRLSLYSEAGRAIDYYFIHGADLDQVIAGYRFVTGRAVLLPRWAYGFWQSRDHYQTQRQLLGVVRKYRALGIPLDNIVQDWRYWKDDAWGSDRFDPTRYPHPRAMIAQVHALHAHFMISVWPKFYPSTRHFKALEKIGGMFTLPETLGIKDWVGPGYRFGFYDPFSAAARHLYWRQIEHTLGALGVDAWWLDADEPDMVSNTSIPEREAFMTPTPLGPGAALFNAYALEHVCGVYHGNLRFRPDRRPFILSRSGFAGLQRCGAAVWSGDIAPRWSDMKNQIAAGIGFSLSGLPNWTMDIGGYQPESRYLHPDAANLAEWRELNTRWFEFGAFCPIFRSHGQMPHREIYNLSPPGTKLYRVLVSYDQLRYRLMPYIYTLAGDTWRKNGTIMRALEMEFPSDPRVRSIATEYMFGPALLVSPVYRYRARRWPVYLPAGASWYDFFTNRVYRGGEQVTVAAPLARLPLFVRAGSIVPVGPAIQYTGERPRAPLTLLVYTGHSGRFTLYEDQGTNRGYRQGQYSLIRFSYDQADGTLSIGARTGSFPGMAHTRQFRIRWIGPGAPSGDDFKTPADVVVTYSGRPIRVRCATCVRGLGART
ncbi:MAG: TIM-barrel domain-containing protein [Steroidobacteraceae bacterium]